MPQIHKWINSKLNNYQNEAVVFLRRGREVPQYPSLIISTAESGHPSTFYYHQTEEKTGEGVFRKLGTSQFRVKAMYVQSRKYEPVKTALAFFDAYYGTVRFRLNQSKESKEELEIFPVLVSSRKLLTRKRTTHYLSFPSPFRASSAVRCTSAGGPTWRTSSTTLASTTSSRASGCSFLWRARRSLTR